jgi:two-component system response regulator HydG
MASYHVVVVDDEVSNLESLERILKSDGGRVAVFRDPHEALRYLQQEQPDILITDLRMDSLSGMEMLEAVKLFESTLEVVLVTAYGTVEIAVEAMKKGAYDFITKPLQRLQVLKSVHMALERRRLLNENASLKEELKSHLENYDNKDDKKLFGKSESMRQLIDVAQQAARSRANVLIEGESGTGKGVLAEYIHRNSERCQGVFVKINCAAIPENLLEAELFGYEPGAFTGASRRKKGRVELSHGGTLFLDEIGIAPLPFQTKLLRFLQEGEFERLGSNETHKVETRVISATNTDLNTAIKNGQLREDLYYRLKVIHFRVPSLRDRQEDIPILAQKFLEDSAKKNGRDLPMLHPQALDCLVRYSWPGNIRELQNLMERLVVLNKKQTIEINDLPPEIGGNQRQKTIVVPVGISIRQIEHLLMDETLKSTRGDKKLAAKLLGVHPRTIYRYLESKEEMAPKLPAPTDFQSPARSSDAG